MPALPLPKYGLDKLYLFPYYSTRESYERTTGQTCPPWDANRRPQHWCQPEAADLTEDFVIYERVLATDTKVSGRPVQDANGKPYTRRLILPKDVASTVNIPPVEGHVENAEVPEYPVPLRALESNEELFFDIGSFGSVMVKNTDLYAEQEEGFTPRDRALLRSIATKLGV